MNPKRCQSTCAVTRPRPLALKGGALPEATSFGVVSSGAVPLGVGELASLTRRGLHLRPVADQGNGQGMSLARRDLPMHDREAVPLVKGIFMS